MTGRSSSDRTQNRENPTRTHPQEPPCLHELFREQAAKTPDETALIGNDRELTYLELDELSDGLAAFLRESGVGRDVPVGIHLERSPEYVVAMLAALKSGGAFLPLELAYPARMVQEVVSDSKMPVVLTKSRYEDGLPGDIRTFCLDDGWQDDLTSSLERLDDVQAEPDDLAFIAYSSGTTGKPKGIANPHRAMVGSYLWRFGVDAPEPGDRVGCNVFFIWEALRPLLCGAATVVIPDDVIYSPDELLAFLKDHEISETLFTPSLLETILNGHEERLSDDIPSLKTLWLNGEVVTKRLIGRAADALPKTRLLNVYSISESHEVAAGDLRKLADLPGSTYCSVGVPANPDTARILDDELEVVPQGEAGELYVGGDWLAREYVGLPEKTAERFIEDTNGGGRIYRTGDRARTLPGGELEILGRADFMVKVRGYSIELGAVETAIEATLPVAGCCVVADGEEGTDKRLVAYVVASGKLPDISTGTGRSVGIRETLKEALPHYAIPSVYVELGSLPLQETTGKVDRTELPAPPARDSGARSGAEIALPENPSEREETEALGEIFEVVLGLDAGDVGADEDFFAIGGHSLAAAEVLSLVADTFGVRLGVSAILDHPSPTSLQRAISRNRDGSQPDEAAPKAASPHEDAKLEAEISPATPPKYKSIKAADGIFLTGATGFFGAFFLRELLDNTNAEISCLVRRRTDDHPSIAAVRDNLRGYGLWRPEYAARLKPVAGDLSSPLLGLVRADFDALAGSIEVIVHAAAAVNLVYPYSALRAVNVEGTREVLRLCTTATPKTLHYISTNGIFPQRHGFCRDNENVAPLIDGLKDGYGQTKWAAERLVSEAEKRGLPAFVYRPGNIAGDTENGAYNRKDLLSAAVAASLSLGASPEPEDDSWRVEMTPVDFVASAVFALASRTNLNGASIFHLANPSPPKAAEFFDLLGDAAGHLLESVPLPEWMERLRASDVPGLWKAVIGDGSTLAYAFATGNTFDDTVTRAALGETEASPERPPLDSALISRYAKALRSSEGDG